jgi:pantetheine-phosphate adenylyltransferase
MKVCFSGTFNVLHKGHKHLIDKAVEIAGKNGTVYIGVTDGEMLRKKKFSKPLNERINGIKEYLSNKGYDKQAVIKIIYNKYGPAINEEYDAIIVSPGSKKNAEEINKKRVENNKKPLKIIEIPYVLAEDKKPISATRILNKEIDENGMAL